LKCMLAKAPSGKKQGQLHPIPPGKRPFEVINMDHLGHFPTATSGKKHLLLIICNLTKYVHLFAVKSTDAADTLKCLTTFISNRGIPKRIISDRGPAFISKEFDDFCMERGIKHTRNSSRHPRANGQIERIHRTVTPIISMLADNEGHWDRRIKDIENHLNCCVNNTIGTTPFYALHGYHPNFNDEFLNFAEVTESYEEPVNLQPKIRERILQEQQKMMEYGKKKYCKAAEFKVGDIVFMKRAPENTGQSKKIQDKYRGPLIISQKLPSDTYRVNSLECSEGRMYSTTSHISDLKLWKLYDEDDSGSETEEDTDTDSNVMEIGPSTSKG